MSVAPQGLQSSIVCPEGHGAIKRYMRRRVWGWLGEKVAGPKGRHTAEYLSDRLARLDRLVVHGRHCP